LAIATGRTVFDYATTMPFYFPQIPPRRKAVGETAMPSTD
jgi:hypothetical protein